MIRARDDRERDAAAEKCHRVGTALPRRIYLGEIVCVFFFAWFAWHRKYRLRLRLGLTLSASCLVSRHRSPSHRNSMQREALGHHSSERRPEHRVRVRGCLKSTGKVKELKPASGRGRPALCLLTADPRLTCRQVCPRSLAQERRFVFNEVYD